ncbi:MAG: hypothetical protein ABR537_05230 [Gemmatimonadales bacterium]
MDRARHAGTAGSSRRRSAGARARRKDWTSLIRSLPLFAVVALCACKITTDADQAVAIEVVLPDSGRVELRDTFLPGGRALNGLGDSVAAQLYWSSLDTTVISVLDSATGASLSKLIGTGRLVAHTGHLFSNPQSVVVLPRPDSIAAGGATRDTVHLTPDSSGAVDSLSAPLPVQAFSADGVPANRRVVYSATTYPATGPLVTFVTNDSVATNSTGVATARLKLLPGAIPDSVVVTAAMRHVNGTLVPGTPTFVVEFQP